MHTRVSDMHTPWRRAPAMAEWPPLSWSAEAGARSAASGRGRGSGHGSGGGKRGGDGGGGGGSPRYVSNQSDAGAGAGATQAVGDSKGWSRVLGFLFGFGVPAVAGAVAGAGSKDAAATHSALTGWQHRRQLTAVSPHRTDAGASSALHSQSVASYWPAGARSAAHSQSADGVGMRAGVGAGAARGVLRDTALPRSTHALQAAGDDIFGGSLRAIRGDGGGGGGVPSLVSGRKLSATQVVDSWGTGGGGGGGGETGSFLMGSLGGQEAGRYRVPGSSGGGGF